MVNTRVSQVLRWADRLPLNVRARFPRLCIFHAWALQFELQLEAVEPALALAEAHLAGPEELQPTSQSAQFSARQITSLASVVRAFVARQRGDCRQAIELSLAALKTLPKGETGDIGLQRGTLTINLGMAYVRLGQMETARQFLQSALRLNLRAGSRYAVLGCIEYLMLAEIACGRLSRALAHGEKGLAWIEEWSHSERFQQRPVRMLAHLRRMMGQVLYEMDDLAQAADYLDKCTAYDELMQSQVRMLDCALLIGLHQALGDVDAALSCLQKLERIRPRPGFSLGDALHAALIAEGCLLISRLRPDLNELFAQAVRWASTSGLAPGDEFRYEQEGEYLTLARVLIAQNRAEEATPLLDRLIASAEGAGRRGQLLGYLSLQAVALQAQHRTDSALAHLSRALALGEAEGYVRTFVDRGPPMRDLLQLATRRGIPPRKAYVSRLLAAFPDYGTEPILSPSAQGERQGIGALVEPLNDREMQILRLLAAGLTNRQIAEELYLSLHTIKWYTTQIYGKLGVHKRAEAVARAYELNML